MTTCTQPRHLRLLPAQPRPNCFGDGFTPDDYAAVGQYPVSVPGARVATAMEARARLGTVAVPAFVLDVAQPTTIGLGDTFVGGFIEAYARGLDG